MKFSHAAFALSTVATLALARRPNAADRAREDSLPRTAFELARFDAHGGYFSGTHLVGFGSVQKYQGANGAMDVEVIRYPDEHFGFSLAFAFGGASENDLQANGGLIFARLQTAAEFGLLSWSGPGKSGWSIGAGMGGDLGKSRYLDDGKAMAYPILLSRLRLWATREVSVHANYQWVPISTGAMPLHAHRFEAAVGLGLLQFGARLELSAQNGGDPVRTFVDRETTLFVGIAVY
jgi:hypothetical protein